MYCMCMRNCCCYYYYLLFHPHCASEGAANNNNNTQQLGNQPTAAAQNIPSIRSDMAVDLSQWIPMDYPNMHSIYMVDGVHSRKQICGWMWTRNGGAQQTNKHAQQACSVTASKMEWNGMDEWNIRLPSAGRLATPSTQSEAAVGFRIGGIGWLVDCAHLPCLSLGVVTHSIIIIIKNGCICSNSSICHQCTIPCWIGQLLADC